MQNTHAEFSSRKKKYLGACEGSYKHFTNTNIILVYFIGPREGTLKSRQQNKQTQNSLYAYKKNTEKITIC